MVDVPHFPLAFLALRWVGFVGGGVAGWRGKDVGSIGDHAAKTRIYSVLAILSTLTHCLTRSCLARACPNHVLDPAQMTREQGALPC